MSCTILARCTARVVPRQTRGKAAKLTCVISSRQLSTQRTHALLLSTPFKLNRFSKRLQCVDTARSYACGCHGGSKAKTAYIALGSNMGDRVAEIERACREMDKRGIRVKRTSSLWETEPMYVTDQDRFLNGACEVETELEPLALLDELQAIENEMGRNKVIDKGPRNIDLDILVYGDEAVSHPRLNVPHIGIPEREFVLRPLAELIPSKPLFASNPWKLVQDYLNDLPASSEPLQSVTPLSVSSTPLSPLAPTRPTRIMSILNVTPDSFSDGGSHNQTNLAATVQAAVASGATILDVGGQSTAPGARQVTGEEEAARILPTIQLIRSMPECASVAISVDTYRADVAEAAINAGADIINDVSAGTLDPDMLPTAARLGATICLMHMRGTPTTMSGMTDYPEGVVAGVASELIERVAAAEAAGIRRWRIMLDPGLGFAKTAEQNLELLRCLGDLRRWPGLETLPWLVGASRKSFVGAVTGVGVPAQRTWGTAATVAAAVAGGADVVRVHDVPEMKQVAVMSDAIWRVKEHL